MSWNRLSTIRLSLALLQLVLVVRMHFIVSRHWTVSLLVDRSVGILGWILFWNYHLSFWVWLVLSVILGMEVGTLLKSWAIAVLHFVIVLSSLGGLITLIIIRALSPGRIIDAVFVVFISFVFVGNCTFFVFTWLSYFTRRLIIVNLDNTSLIGLLSKNLYLTVNTALLRTLLLLILKD